MWKSLIPKAFRQPSDPVSVAERQRQKAAKKAQGWNPATFFIIISILIGNNAIQMIALKRDMLNYTRKTEAKIALLREVIGKVQAGEEVDVERILGTGNADREQEWQDVMDEIANEQEALWENKNKKKKELARQKQAEEAAAAEASEKLRISDMSGPEQTREAAVRRPGFY
ncbi:hypothetical protein M8818_006308 [Zalaria obscura]|uniref:Uncharacterized protein n=1 Tax=Zalaria obscura TaxID=2024903 RepID=A0ACC3S7H8_9PEZI